MKKTLVTGADGFIGSHLVEELVCRGVTVRAFVMYNALGSWGWMDRVNPEIRASVEVQMGDIRDSQSVAGALEGCDTVFHLAALIGIPYSYRAADSYLDTNIKGTLNLLQAAKRENIDRFVHTSTSEVYGTAQTVPINENHPLNAQSPYAATKIAADQLAGSFYRSFGLPVTIVRPFNTYGPRQSARAIIPTVVSQITSGEQKIRLGALTPTRDFNFVSDTAQGMIAAANSVNTIGEAVNLATGHEVSIGRLVETIADLMRAYIEIEQDSARMRPEASEVERLCGDASKIHRLAGWRPEHGGEDGLRRGLEKTIDWFTRPENAASYRPGQYAV